MTAPSAPSTRARQIFWLSWVLSAVPIGMMLFSASFKFRPSQEVIAFVVDHLGYQASILPKLGVLEITCILLYAIPRTSMTGAILVTGYLGGAMASHTRVGDPVFIHILLILLAWGGLYLREPRLKALLPLR